MFSNFPSIFTIYVAIYSFNTIHSYFARNISHIFQFSILKFPIDGREIRESDNYQTMQRNEKPDEKTSAILEKIAEDSLSPATIDITMSDRGRFPVANDSKNSDRNGPWNAIRR